MTRPLPAVPRSLHHHAALVLAATAWTASAPGAVHYSQPGALYSQSFDWTTGDLTFGTWSNNSATQAIATWVAGADSLGWHLDAGGTPTSFRAGTGLTSTQIAHNFFTNPTDADRSLGSVTNSGAVTIALLLRNASAHTLTEFTFSYTLETTAILDSGSLGQQASFGYHVGTPANWVADTFAQPGSPYDGQLRTGYGFPIIWDLTAVDGNDPLYRDVRSGLAVTGLEWAPGEDLWLRWEINSVPRGVNFGIDDFSFTAIPEPGSAGAWVALGACGAVLRRRRRAAAR